MNKEDFEGKKIEDIQKELANEIAEYTAQVQVMDLDDLKKEEANLMERFKENDEYIKSVSYQLPKEIDIEITKGNSVKMKAQEVKRNIVDFLNTVENTWSTSAAIYQIIIFWSDNQDNKVPYYILDSTLRTLGSVVKYKGKNDLQKILEINNYLSTIHDEYIKDNLYIQYLSSLHQAIMNQMETLQKEKEGSNVVEMN